MGAFALLTSFLCHVGSSLLAQEETQLLKLQNQPGHLRVAAGAGPPLELGSCLQMPRQTSLIASHLMDAVPGCVGAKRSAEWTLSSRPCLCQVAARTHAHKQAYPNIYGARVRLLVEI